jgi:hypothetical protein
MSDVILGVVGDSLLVEVGMHEGFELSVKAADDFIFDGTVKMLVPLHSRVLESNSVKIITITLKFKHTPDDAALGFFRSSLHEDSSLFSSVKDYLAIEKGWMSPYLFASGRRPVIPRSVSLTLYVDVNRNLKLPVDDSGLCVCSWAVPFRRLQNS